MIVRLRRVDENRVELQAGKRRFVATFHGTGDPVCTIPGWWLRELRRDKRGVDWQSEVAVGLRRQKDVKAAVVAEVKA